MNDVAKFASELENKFKWNNREGWKVEYYENSTWIRIYFSSDRTILQDNLKKIEELLINFNLKGSLTTSYTWNESHYYDGFLFKNPDIVYVLFITNSNKQYELESIDISDTTDPLYDTSLFALRDAMKEKDIFIPEFTHYKRTNFGFIVIFYTKKSAIEFYNKNPFNRIMNLEEEIWLDEKIYYCNIYMNDKIPNPIPENNFIIRNPQIKPVKNKNSIIKAALAKLTDEEKIALDLYPQISH